MKKFLLLALLAAFAITGVVLAKSGQNPSVPGHCTPDGGVQMPFPVTEVSPGPPQKLSYGYIVVTQCCVANSEPPVPIPGRYKSDPPVGQAYPYITVNFFDDGSYTETTSPTPPATSYQSGSGSYKAP